MFSFLSKLVKNGANLNRDDREIGFEEIDEKIATGAVLIDVRSKQEYEEGHIIGAISIPEYEMRKRAKIELLDNKQEIIVYCSSGSRSKKAKKLLNQLGYENVYNLYNGWQNY